MITRVCGLSADRRGGWHQGDCPGASWIIRGTVVLGETGISSQKFGTVVMAGTVSPRRPGLTAKAHASVAATCLMDRVIG